jgi:AbiV family abortive infection protein
VFDWLYWALLALLLLVFAFIVWRKRRPKPKGRKPKVTMSDSALTPDDLLRGALYALEQSGLLANDAAVLLEAKRYPTPAAIALLAIEEIGRHKILLDFWRSSINGRVITRQEVIHACESDHVAKQRHGQSSITYRSVAAGQIDRLVRAKLDPLAVPREAP